MRVLQRCSTIAMMTVLLTWVPRLQGQHTPSGQQPSSQSNPVINPTTNPTTQQPNSPVGLSEDPTRDRFNAMQAEQAKMRNNERQQKLVDDTNQLLDLAAQLKIDVDKSNKDMLSIDVIKKADEIEKLAKSVKDRMKGSG
jgi:hypothetical protein